MWSWWFVGAGVLVVAVVAAVLLVPRSTTVGEGSAVSVIGDSYSQGTVLGGQGPANWASVLAAARRWRLSDVAVGGTGYTQGRDPYGPYAVSQLDRALATEPALVIVQGSINDGAAPAPTVEGAATALFADIRRRAPAARLVVVGPFRPGDPGGVRSTALRDAVERAAVGADAVFVDPLAEDWFADSPHLVGADGVHPTDSGHARMAQRIGEDLRDDGI